MERYTLPYNITDWLAEPPPVNLSLFCQAILAEFQEVYLTSLIDPEDWSKSGGEVQNQMVSPPYCRGTRWETYHSIAAAMGWLTAG